jgi:uncharacterized membrane protein
MAMAARFTPRGVGVTSSFRVVVSAAGLAAAEDSVGVVSRAAAACQAAAAQAGDGEMRAQDFLGEIDEAAVLAAVREAERRTSGEVRVFVSRRRSCKRSVLERARAEFHRLDMDTTDDRNAVLFYVAPKIKAFAVVGDEAIHAKFGQEFWEATAKALEGEFSAGRFTEGLVSGIRRAGNLLAEHFPRRPNDGNELPDAIARD